MSAKTSELMSCQNLRVASRCLLSDRTSASVERSCFFVTISTGSWSARSNIMLVRHKEEYKPSKTCPLFESSLLMLCVNICNAIRLLIYKRKIVHWKLWRESPRLFLFDNSDWGMLPVFTRDGETCD